MCGVSIPARRALMTKGVLQKPLQEANTLTKPFAILLAGLVVLSVLLGACGSRATPVPEPTTASPAAQEAATAAAPLTATTNQGTGQVATAETPGSAIGQVAKAVEQVAKAVGQVGKTSEQDAKPPEAYTTPHPILADGRVRQAIAYCIDRDALIAAVYPLLSEEQRDALRMDATLPKPHWAYKGPYAGYEYSVEKGSALLEEAGWTLAEGATVRTNQAGERLALKLTTTTAPFRQTWGAVAAENAAACGIELVPQYTEAAWWLGDTSGLARRDFELGAFAWVGEPDPRGTILYGCDQIPLASNNWQGQNYMGWCNKTADAAITAVSHTLEREDRIAEYDVFHKEFAQDVVSLPLFQHLLVEAWTPNLEGIRVSPTEGALASASSWKLAEGGNSVVVGLAQEPASLFELVEGTDAARQVYGLGVSRTSTQFDFNYQPGIQDPLSTVENSLSISETVSIKAGDLVYTAQGTPARLEEGVAVFDAEGNRVRYTGSAPIKMKRLVSTYKFKDYKWSDGTPGAAADLDLGYLIDCDPDSGNTSFERCDQVQEFRAGPTLAYTIKWLPGAQPWLYFLAPFHIYPSHQVLSDGRKLADVPAAEWAALPEIAEQPLSMAPFVLTEWQKGESMTFTRNKYFQPAPALETIIIRFYPDSQAAVAALLSGDVAFLDKAALGTGAAVQPVMDAAQEGKLVVKTMGSPTWEHMDFSLFTK